MFQRQPWSLPPQVQGSCLRLTPVAWAKLLCLRDSGDCEVGGFGLTSAEDLLLVQDILLVQQQVSAVTVAFDDTAVADLFENRVEQGHQPEEFGRASRPDRRARPKHVGFSGFVRAL